MSLKVNKKGFTSLLIILVLLVLAGGAYVLITKQGSLTKQNPTANSNLSQNEVTISGNIVDNDTSCSHDGVCKVKIDNYWIITDLGGDPSPEMIEQRGPRGRIINTDETTTGNIGNNVTGKQVEVFAKVIDGSTLTLYGKKDYYIKFTNQ